METFLKLPKEILLLIFSNIKDESTIKKLLYIPGLQYIALEQKYPKYEINDDQNKSIEALIELFQLFKFIPSLIIGNVKQISQLINEPSFKLVNYEVKILKGTTFTDLISISKEVHIVGLHLDQYLDHCLENFINKKVKPFLTFVQSTFLQSLTTSHFDLFPIQFPKSLKELTLDKGYKIKLDISDLHHLESLKCKNLHEMSSLDNIQLPLSIKNLRLDSCDIETLGDLFKYKNLNLLHISSCPELFDLINTSYPDSLETLNFISNFHPQRIKEVSQEDRFSSSYFSEFWESRICVGAEFRFPPNLKNLKICDTMQNLEVENIEVSRTLNCLELDGLACLMLKQVVVSLPKKMSEIIISNCLVVAEGHVAFPELERIKFTNNDVILFPLYLNLNQLKSLKVLDMSDNYSSCLEPGPYRFDPLDILTDLDENVCFNSPTLQNLVLKSSVSLKHRSYSSLQVSFQCENLTKLKMIGLDIKSLDLYQLPKSLEELIINVLELKTIQGNFFRLNNLKKLDLENNQITFSIFSSQHFPSGLTHLNLSINKIEDLSCLVLDNCIHLKDLKLKEVTSERTPEGAIQLMNSLLYVDPHIDAILTNYDSEVIFEIVNGVEKILISKSFSKKRRIR
ncbi:uncharacterized protein KGF55_004608 [Candida pseudojiufengensis]|uniref:uncharacterized protein n=1 Tax=Candida pseudojiufengensis TaxID=497109 RepID=UPI00222579D2|nr:uncharacterized protein KGF55_004608 [Candida pseudojiufengensis]KAI5960316.1 hypothetical protein KGF55_004608 [Candida pseudojiufengensis]